MGKPGGSSARGGGRQRPPAAPPRVLVRTRLTARRTISSISVWLRSRSSTNLNTSSINVCTRRYTLGTVHEKGNVRGYGASNNVRSSMGNDASAALKAASFSACTGA